MNKYDSEKIDESVENKDLSRETQTGQTLKSQISKTRDLKDLKDYRDGPELS